MASKREKERDKEGQKVKERERKKNYVVDRKSVNSRTMPRLCCLK